jgi:hypothetical protein
MSVWDTVSLWDTTRLYAQGRCLEGEVDGLVEADERLVGVVPCLNQPILDLHSIPGCK